LLVALAVCTLGVLVPTAVPVGPAGAAATNVAPFRNADAFVRQQFRDFQGGSPATSEVAPYLPGLADGSKTAGEVVGDIAHVGVRAERNGNVTRLYTAYFQRLPDIGGLEYWVGKSENGWTLNKISANFAGSSEFIRKYGSLSNAGFVDRAFQNVFGRAADPGGRTYWTGKLNKGMSRGAVMVGFSQSNEYQRKQLATTEMVLAYRGLLRRIPTGTEATDATAVVQAEGFDALADDLVALPAYAARFPKPGAPTSLVAYPGDAKVSLEWKAASANGAVIAGYVLRVNKGAVQQGGDRLLAANATSTVVTGLTNESTYTFSLFAYSTARDGAAVTSGAVAVRPEVVWSTFQGNAAHTGVQPIGVVPATPTKKWVAEFARPVQQVVVGDGRIFAVTEGVHSGSTTNGSGVYALDPADGSILWGPVTVAGGSYGRAYLGYENKRVFVSNDEGLIQAIDSRTGAVKWSVNLDSFIWFQRGLTVADGSLYTFDDGGLVAINTSNGGIRWRAGTMNDSGTPAADGSGVYVSQACDYVYRFSLTGQRIWNSSSNCTGGGAGETALAAGRVWSSGGYLDDGSPIRNQGDGSRVGTAYGDESPAISGWNVVYNDDATLRGVDWNSGELLWSQAGDGSLTGPPVINAGRTYARSEEGWVFSYTVASGVQAWSRDVFADVDTDLDQYDAFAGDLAIGDGLLLVPLTITYPDDAGAIVAYG
jgi:outer membrane protein assembly factor BamB